MSAVDRTHDLGDAWLDEDDCDLDELQALVFTETELGSYPHASAISHNVPVYDWPQLRGSMHSVAARGGPTSDARRALSAELVRALHDGPGIVVLAGAFEPDVVDRVTAAFEAMIAAQRESGAEAGDHFAPPGANDRVWNALEKLAVREPDLFVDYYANDALAVAADAWLGPAYQVTSQVNVVNPGGAAQTVHRDYHLGFMDATQAAAYPAHVHRLSPALTLQGAVAHCEMPVESGPTRYLPHSQKLLAGYLASHRAEFRRHFDAEHVQLPLHKGDAVFFNPALFHAAGTNSSDDIRRVANLVQISSAFGRAMESVDRARVSAAIFPALQARRRAGWSEDALRRALAAAAEGYAFPTDLDLDQPVDGPVPQAQADLVWQALGEDWTTDQLRAGLDAHAGRRRTHEGTR
jgi:ectoine hydroxylase-related dioxygenase (phytanoyl-CoA dioxygenase family)